MRRRLLALASVVALVLSASPAVAAPPAASPLARFERVPSGGAVKTAWKPLSLGASGRVTVIVEMKGDPVAVVEADKGHALTASERSAVKSSLKKNQDAILGTLKSRGGRIQATMQSAYNGIQLSIPAKQVDALAALPNVVAVYPARTYTVGNAVSVPFLGVPQVWQSTGFTGKGVKVAIIDTGIDYTHANFGGPGTAAAYTAAHAAATTAADPALFGPGAPRVKGGWDFVGDDYDASDDAKNVPQPDPNPLDCQGHGSHVAGTAAGSGVTAGGKTYTGPYDASTASKAWTIGPGVAPQADLYALRVFGCDGSTDVVVPAIDWAVDHGMNVINMSLGSSFGRADDPDAVAASNAVGAGVVVVASAGNAGPSPYLVGSPSVGEGVISVAAVDSTASFPGAEITLSSGKVPAINANGASLSGLGPMTVVYLKDDPTTPENESLGCSVEAYTSNGVAPGGNQMAVSTRGVCARVAKAIFAQQAGAAASVMVNTSDAYPPFEGPITSNPDDGTPYTVTIPFLGVKGSSAGALQAAAGQSATVAAATLANPSFRHYADFTSNGPRSGDSALGPDVAAPGVSIVSTAVGTGNGAETMSGTSMAAPHVTGVAALAVQAHPGWTAGQVAAAVVSTADPTKLAGASVTLGGVGLVNAAGAVAAQATATGDAFRTTSGWLRETALSFGFQEASLAFGGLKTITVTNHGSKSMTFRVTTVPSAQSLPARVSVSSRSVTVRPGGSARLLVSLTARASDVPSSTAGDMFNFYEFSGDVVLTSGSTTLRVPYLMVPRSTTRAATTTRSLLPRGAAAAGTRSVRLTNLFGAYAAEADFYTWGLSDGRDAPRAIPDTGYDLRAAGVQSFDWDDGDQLLVFAVNNWRRWSSAAQNDYEVNIDTDRDGRPDYVVFATDSGLVRAGDPDGTTEVFIAELATGSLFSAGFRPSSPTDSSTILIPVLASDLGLSAGSGAFRYTVESFSVVNSGQDAFSGWAAYDPWSPALENGQFVTVPRNRTASVGVAVNAKAFAAQKPLGVMAVVMDNAAGPGEALLIPAR